jgi:hypothetical protein
VMLLAPRRAPRPAQRTRGTTARAAHAMTQRGCGNG